MCHLASVNGVHPRAPRKFKLKMLIYSSNLDNCSLYLSRLWLPASLYLVLPWTRNYGHPWPSALSRLLCLAYMDVGEGREQDAEALLPSHYLTHRRLPISKNSYLSLVSVIELNYQGA